MLDFPVAAVGLAVVAGAAVALSGLTDNGAEDDESARIAGLQSRLQDARASTAMTYREVDRGSDTDVKLDDAEAEQRREQVLARAQEMLDGARVALQEGLDEAVRSQDYDTAEEYLEMLEKLKPLPPGIVPTSPPTPGYKRWLDSGPRRS